MLVPPILKTTGHKEQIDISNFEKEIEAATISQRPVSIKSLRQWCQCRQRETSLSVPLAARDQDKTNREETQEGICFLSNLVWEMINLPLDNTCRFRCPCHIDQIVRIPHFRHVKPNKNRRLVTFQFVCYPARLS